MNRAMRGVAFLAAALVLGSGATAADDGGLPEAPAIEMSGAVQPLVEFTPKQLDDFLRGFTVTAAQVVVGASGGAAADPVVRGILDSVLGHRGSAAAAGAAAAPAAPAHGPDDRIRPDMPNLFPSGTGLAQQQHMIFYDTHDPHFNADWKRQAELMAAQLRRAGVPAANVHLAALNDRDQFFRQLGDVHGGKQVYFFGHGSPLTLWIGDQSVNVGDSAARLQGAHVSLIAHYGCSFVDVNNAGLRGLQGNLAGGTSITLVGHRDGSTPYDDRWWDPNNPLTRVTVSPTQASMHTARTELTNRVVPTIGALLGTPLMGPVPAVAAAVGTWQADIGTTPTTLAEERAREAARRKKAAGAGGR